MRFSAYLWMLTPAYPKRLFGDESLALAERRSAGRPLLLSGSAKALVVLFLVLGALSGTLSSVYSGNNGNSGTITTYLPNSAAGH
jgi:hypothetical protein